MNGKNSGSNTQTVQHVRCPKCYELNKKGDPCYRCYNPGIKQQSGIYNTKRGG
jgi:hypothetical protein